MKKNAYEINHLEAKITMTKKFYEAACRLNTPEYKELMAIRRDNPTYKMEVREIKKKTDKNSYRNLTFDNMELFIKKSMDSTRPLDERLNEYAAVKELSRVQSSPYEQMKKFISQCRDAEERKKTFERVFALSQAQRSPYHYMKAWFLDNYANYNDKPKFDTDGFVIVKTKAQLEAEKKMEQQNMANQSMPIADAQSEADAA